MFSKKKILAAALVICVIAIISTGTLAWFSDEDKVENSFMIATSDDDTPDEIFSVDVWEDTPGGIIGKGTDNGGYDYGDILPGDSLKKEVYVENTGYYNQYIRVTVTISNTQAWAAVVGDTFNPADVFIGFDATKWTHIWNNLEEARANGDPVPQDIVYTLYYKYELEPGADKAITVFEKVKIPQNMTQQQAAAFNGEGFNIDVKAEAVQTKNLGAENVGQDDKAWTAFKNVANPNYTAPN